MKRTVRIEWNEAWAGDNGLTANYATGRSANFLGWMRVKESVVGCLHIPFGIRFLGWRICMEPDCIQTFEGYLSLLAAAQIRSLGRFRHDHRDVVQETFARAHANWDQFNGTTKKELAGWLRRILQNYIVDLVRKTGREFDEQRLQEQLDESYLRLEDWLQCDELTPRRHALKDEMLLRLSDALIDLPDDQRTAIELRYISGLKVAEIAQQMQRSTASVGGLLQRGMASLRQHLTEDSE